MSDNKAKEIAIEVLESNSYIKEVHVTTDHKPFAVISDAQNYAAKKFDDAESKKIKTFSREGLGVVSNTKKEIKVSALIKVIKEAKTPEEIYSLIEKEHRPFVLKTAEACLRKFTPEVSEDSKESEEINNLKKENSNLKADLEKVKKANANKDKALKAKDVVIKDFQKRGKTE